MTKTLGLIGGGMIGGGLARLAVAAGLHVVLSNSRGPQTLAGLVAELGGHARAATPEEAARAGDLVVATVPLKAYDRLPAAALAGKVVIDTMNYYPDRDGRIAELDTGGPRRGGHRHARRQLAQRAGHPGLRAERSGARRPGQGADRRGRTAPGGRSPGHPRPGLSDGEERNRGEKRGGPPVGDVRWPAPAGGGWLDQPTSEASRRYRPPVLDVEDVGDAEDVEEEVVEDEPEL